MKQVLGRAWKVENRALQVRIAGKEKALHVPAACRHEATDARMCGSLPFSPRKSSLSRNADVPARLCRRLDMGLDL